MWEQRSILYALLTDDELVQAEHGYRDQLAKAEDKWDREGAAREIAALLVEQAIRSSDTTDAG